MSNSNGTIDENKTKITLKLVIMLAIGVATMSYWGSTIRRDIADLQRNNITRVEVVDWRDRLADENPAMKVPRISLKSPKQEP